MGTWAVSHRIRDAREAGYVREAILRQLSKKLFDEIEPEKHYTVRYSFDSRPVHGHHGFDYETEMCGDIEISEVQYRDVVMSRPQAVDEMEWPRLLKTATRETWDRIKAKFRRKG